LGAAAGGVERQNQMQRALVVDVFVLAALQNLMQEMPGDSHNIMAIFASFEMKLVVPRHTGIQIAQRNRYSTEKVLSDQILVKHKSLQLLGVRIMQFERESFFKLWVESLGLDSGTMMLFSEIHNNKRV